MNAGLCAALAASLTFIASQSATTARAQLAPPPGVFAPPPVETSNPDVNGDGRDDFLAQNATIDAQGIPQFSVVVVGGSPDDGGDLYTITSPETADMFGFAASRAGDLDGDGKEDIVVAAFGSGDPANPSGKVYAYSGGTQALLWTFAGQPGEAVGQTLAPIGDVNGDGKMDFAAAGVASDAAGQDAGRVYVLSGANGQALYSVDGPAAHAVFGHSIAGLGDVNADGVPDFAVGAPGDPNTNPNAVGAVTIRSGANGALLFPCLSPQPGPGDAFGAYMASVGDVNGDGVRDFVVAAPGAAMAFGLSGVDCAPLYTLTGAPGETFGVRVAPRSIANDVAGQVEVMSVAPDANGDGVPDSKGWVFNAATGALLFVENDATGTATTPISADVNADGAVTTADLALIVDAVGATTTRADVTADGTVDAADAMQVVGSLGATSFTTSASAANVLTCPDGTPAGPDGCPRDRPDLEADLCEDSPVGGGGGVSPPPPPPGPNWSGYIQCQGVCSQKYTNSTNAADWAYWHSSAAAQLEYSEAPPADMSFALPLPDKHSTAHTQALGQTTKTASSTARLGITYLEYT